MRSLQINSAGQMQSRITRSDATVARLYALKQPNGRPEWDFYLLDWAARLKKFYVGTFYVPSRQELVAVFKPTPGTYVSPQAFEPISEDELREAYKMVCLKCGRCCEARCGAFLLGRELAKIPRELLPKLPRRVVKTLGGKVYVYALDIGPMGRCVLYKAGCTLERVDPMLKPIICMLTYCTGYAERNGEYYVKVSVKKGSKGPVPVYRKVTPEEWEQLKREATLHRLKTGVLPVQEQKESQ